MDHLDWDERYRTGEYSPRQEPSGLLRRNVDWFPDGRALDVATGTGRNAVFLAERGYDVDAVDLSSEALEMARDSAEASGLDVRWIQADLSTFDVPPETYDLVNVSFYYDLNLLPDLIDGLAPGGVLVVEHHLQPASAFERGPSTDRYRLRSNDLLRACLELTVLEYRERMDTSESGQRAATASIIARKGDGADAVYPPA